MGHPFTVRLAAESDSDVVLRLLAEYLEEMKEYPLSPEPGSAQASAIAEVIRRGLFRGDPIVLATSTEDFEPIGCSWWTWVPTSPQTDLSALGTYVVRKWRKRGVARELRALAEKEAKERGYSKIVGTLHIHNPVGIASLTMHGWKSAYFVVTKEI